MEPIEIIVIMACVLIVGGVVIKSIINKIKGRTSYGCGGDCCKCKGCSSVIKKQNSNHENT